jgi:OOP family OmpA-OmpF porin
MKNNLFKIISATILLAVMSGCAMHPERSGPVAHFSTFCTLAGVVTGGGGAAAITMAAGPIGAAAFVGGLLGSLACTEEDPKPMAAAPAPMPAPAPQPVAAAPEPVAPAEPRILMTLTGVNFKFDSSAIEPESERILDRAVTELNNAGSVDVVIVGHTDSTGTDAYNMALSHRRANAVKDYLVRHGISSSRLSTEGRGESQPVASNATREGRYQNRRIEFHTTGTMSSRQSPGSRATSGDSTIESWRRLDQTVVNF